MSHIGIEEEDAQIGKTKVFMRKNVYELLEVRRSNKLNKSAVQIQSIYRCYVARNAFVTKLYAAIVIASFARGIKAKKRVNELRQLYASICIQSKFRSYVCRAKFMSDRRKWILIQNIYPLFLLTILVRLILLYYRAESFIISLYLIYLSLLYT